LFCAGVYGRWGFFEYFEDLWGFGLDLHLILCGRNSISFRVFEEELNCA